MRSDWKTSCPCWVRGGLTLIEVVAALVILGTLLTAVLMAEGRCRRQTIGARMRLSACTAADELLTRWWAGPEKFPVDAEGDLKGDSQLHWKTESVENDAAEEMDAQVVRLSIFTVDGPWQNTPLVTVDVVLPLEQPKGPEGLHAD